jgi:hypothetical protein
MNTQPQPTQSAENAEEESLEGMPRFIKSWRQVYLGLLLWLLLLMVLIYVSTEVWQ